MKTAIIFGVTGLTGKALLHNIVEDARYSKIYIVTRRPCGFIHPKVEEILFNYKNFKEMPSIKADHVFCCLGTTIKKAGSKEAQQIIDRDYPIEIAKYANTLGAEKMVTVSSIGADAKSSNFYLRTKGEMEEGVKSNFKHSVFVRPSFLLGNREEMRIGEKIGIALFSIINPLLFGSLSKYKGIQVSQLSKAMINACFNKTEEVLYYKDF
ncbi:MAG: oxidoreductase [Bacteroidetes bacterium]|nr:oxidoreductase [Bacteroidota bacterium]